MTWTIEHDDDNVPVRMRWGPDRPRSIRRCPRTFPHKAHGPWFDGVPVPVEVASGFDCPGVPLQREAE